MKKLLIFGALSMLMLGSNYAQTRIPVKAGENQLQVLNAERSGLSLQNTVAYIDVQLEKRTRGEHVELEMIGYGKSFNIGNPDLPVLNRLIEVPADAIVVVNVVGYNEVTLKLSDYDINKLIAPSQESVSKSADPDKIPYVKNDRVYATNAWFSNPMAQYHEVGVMRGVRMGRIEINPLTYNPVTGELKIFNDMKIEISFQNANFSKTDAEKARLSSPAFNGLLSGMLNYSPATKDLNIHGTPMKFVIVSHRMFEATLAPFVAWKKKQGFNTILRFTDEAGVGTTSAAIKTYLQGLYTAGTQQDPAPSFVMLVGDHEQIPAFSGTAGSHISDLYFVTFDGPTDLIPDINIGRMSAKTVAQLEPLIAKTLQYQQFTMPDPSYLSNGLLIAGVDASYATVHGNGALNYIINAYFNTAHGINSTNIFYPASNGAGVPAQIIQVVNNGLAWGNYTAHCSPSGWAQPSFETSAIASLTANEKYGLYIGNCCQSSQFNNDVCFAEAITRAANKGAIGYIGGTNSTYWDEDYWWATGFGTVVQNPTPANFGPGSYDALFHELLPNENVYSTTQSQINIAGCLAVNASNSSRKKYYWEIYHLMGDPTLTPYIGPMPSMEPNYLATLPMGLNTLSITNLPSKAYVALTDNGEIKFAGFANTNGEINVVFDAFMVPTTADLVITAPFTVPFIGSVDIIPSDSPFVVYFGSTIDDAAGNGNGSLDFDETVSLTVTLKNVGTVNATNVTATLSTDNPYISILESEFNFGDITAETQVTLANVFTIKAAKNIPDQTKAAFTITATDGVNDPWITTFNLTANAPSLINLSYQHLEITGNGNGRIDAGEVIRITVPVKNNGQAAGYPMTAMLFSNLVAVDVESVETSSNALAPGAIAEFIFDITTASEIPVGTPLTLELHLTSDIFSFIASHSYSVGLMTEDFESGSFATYNWTNGGNAPWTIVNTGAYQGTYAAKSGTINHSQTSSLSLTMNVPSAGNISFYRKTDSESNYDKLFFKIDGTTANGTGWSGNQSWEQFTYPVTAGNRTFTWEYLKDGSVSTGSDAAWIDMIIFPGAAAINNTAPYFVSEDVDSATCDIQYEAILLAQDAQGDALNFIAESIPQWLTLTDNSDGSATLVGLPTRTTAFEHEQIVVSVGDGMFKTTKVINLTVHGINGIPVSRTATQMSVYPNPSEGKSTLTYHLLKGNRVVVEILNLNGQKVKTVLNQPMTVGEQQTTVNFEGLASGVYIVRLISGDIIDNLYVVVK
jgi:hypothetical protein